MLNALLLIASNLLLFGGFGWRWHWVVTAGMEGMTTQYAPYRQPATAPQSKPFYGLDSVGRAGRMKSTDRWK